MRSNKFILLGTLFLALPAAAVAQQEGEAEVEAEAAVEACTVTLQPTDLPAGQEAVHVMGTLSGDFGPVTGFEASTESGLAIAEADDIPLDEMANEEVEAVEEIEVETDVEEGEVEVEVEAETEELEYSPIVAGAEPNTFSLWLSTENAAAGAFDVIFTTAEASCDATVTVVTEGETEDN
jgi:hypothetical protein